MTLFTDNPFEKMMIQRPGGRRDNAPPVPHSPACASCPRQLHRRSLRLPGHGRGRLNAENGLLIFVCNIYEIFVMQKCYVIFILQLELSITNILKIFTESGYHSIVDLIRAIFV